MDNELVGSLLRKGYVWDGERDEGKWLFFRPKEFRGGCFFQFVDGALFVGYYKFHDIVYRGKDIVMQEVFVDSERVVEYKVPGGLNLEGRVEIVSMALDRAGDFARV